MPCVIYPPLFHLWNYFLSVPTCMITPQRHRQTDRR